MSQKKFFLMVFLSLLSVLFSWTLSQLDFFGFLDGRHTISFTYLISTLLFSYLILFIVFLLDFSDRQDLITVYSGQVLFFAITHIFATFDIPVTAATSILYYLFLLLLNREITRRSKMFVKFIPGEIFFPVLKKAFLFLLVFFAIINFFRTKSLINDSSLLTPQITRHITRPVTLILNKQIGAQLEQQLGDKFESAIGSRERHRIVSFVLKELVETMGEGQFRQYLGFRPDNVPVEKVIVYDNGDIDITPVVDAMLPDITDALNRKLKEYFLFAPLAIAIITVLLFSALMLPVQAIESIISLVFFKILLAFGFLKIVVEQSEVERVRL